MQTLDYGYRFVTYIPTIIAYKQVFKWRFRARYKAYRIEMVDELTKLGANIHYIVITQFYFKIGKQSMHAK